MEAWLVPLETDIVFLSPCGAVCAREREEKTRRVEIYIFFKKKRTSIWTETAVPTYRPTIRWWWCGYQREQIQCMT